MGFISTRWGTHRRLSVLHRLLVPVGLLEEDETYTLHKPNLMSYYI